MTYGRRTGRGLCIFGAGTGVGKTDLLMQQVEHDINVLGINVGVFFFEQNPRDCDAPSR
jgi:twinkle protein